MRIVTWNVNSVRLRLDQVLGVLRTLNPDVLCLQEIKCATGLFPSRPLVEAGYVHQHVRGQKAYNGVAILSRRPFAARGGEDWGGAAGEARHAWVRFDGGPELHNFYIPAGGDEPDPDVNPKFAQKLRFLDALTAWAGGLPAAGGIERVLVGDFNVAPLETDVWSHRQLLRVVSHTPIEVEKLTAFQTAGGFVDAVRRIVPPREKLFTWWSYRARDWRKTDRGRRLDHIWVSPGLSGRIADASVMDAARDWEKPSDHAPVSVTLTP